MNDDDRASQIFPPLVAIRGLFRLCRGNPREVRHHLIVFHNVGANCTQCRSWSPPGCRSRRFHTCRRRQDKEWRSEPDTPVGWTSVCRSRSVPFAGQRNSAAVFPSNPRPISHGRRFKPVTPYPAQPSPRPTLGLARVRRHFGLDNRVFHGGFPPEDMSEK